MQPGPLVMLVGELDRHVPGGELDLHLVRDQLVGEVPRRAPDPQVLVAEPVHRKILPMID